MPRRGGAERRRRSRRRSARRFRWRATPATITDPWYGTIKIRQAGKRPDHRIPALDAAWSGPLTHYQYDTFKTNPSFKWIEPAYVTFSIDADGKVDRITMKPVSPVADFSSDYQDLLFTPVAGQ